MKNKIVVIVIAAALLAVLAVVVYRGVSLAPRKSPSVPAVSVAPTGDDKAIFAHAQELEAGGETLKARQLYQKLIEDFPGSNNLPKIQERLDNINIKILFSPAITEDSFLYEIQKGDNLTKIAKLFGTTVDLISRANNLSDSNIMAGKKLKLTKAKFSIVVDKSQNILTLKSGESIFKTYKVSTGKNSCTPTGTFKITIKIVDPPWYPPAGGVVQSGDPKNVLGSRWLGISKESYGIHGTIDPGSIGTSVTEGCVRMTNQDVEELYTIVPVDTEVVIVE